MAPRDVSAGGSYAASIVDAIENAHSLILIYTINCNTSPHVLREVERALQVGLNIIPVRFDDSAPSKSLNYLLATVHWLSVAQGSRDTDVPKAVDRIVLTLGQIQQTSRASQVEDAVVRKPLELYLEQARTTPPVGVNRRLWILGIFIVVAVGGLGYFLSNQPAAPPPVVNQTVETASSPAVIPTREAPLPIGPSASPVITPAAMPIPVLTPPPVELPTPSEAAAAPKLQRENVEQLSLKGTWSTVVQQTFDHTIDITTSKLVLDGNKFVFTKTTKTTFRPGVTRPREVPKNVQGFSHVTRYAGEVIFRNRDIIKIKLLTVDFPVRYPAWLSSAKKKEQNEANYVAAKAVWTLRWAGGNLVDAEEASTILRPER